MMLHNFYCGKCGFELQTIDTKTLHICPTCNEEMYWDLKRGVKDGNIQEFWCQELGLLNKKQQDDYKKIHPEAQFNSKGAMLIRGLRHQDRVCAEKGMVALTDSKEYREYQKEQMELARSGKFDKKE